MENKLKDLENAKKVSFMIKEMGFCGAQTGEAAYKMYTSSLENENPLYADLVEEMQNKMNNHMFIKLSKLREQLETKENIIEKLEKELMLIHGKLSEALYTTRNPELKKSNYTLKKKVKDLIEELNKVPLYFPPILSILIMLGGYTINYEERLIDVVVAVDKVNDTLIISLYF